MIILNNCKSCLDNETDPLSIIKIFKFDTISKKRKAELSSTNTTFFGTNSNNLNYSSKKFKEKSYLLTIDDPQPGEYGIIVSNPNNRDEKSTIVSTFSIQ